MKNFLWVILSITIIYNLTSCKKGDFAEFSFPVPDTVAYAIGTMIGNGLQQDGVEGLEKKSFKKGLSVGQTELSDSILQLSSIAINDFMQQEYNFRRNLKMQDSTAVIPPILVPDSVSYHYGVMVGNNIMNQNLVKINLDTCIAGISDILTGEMTLNPKIIERRMAFFYKDIDKKRQQYSKDFLEKNKKKKGVVTTKSGLQYTVLKPSKGEKPTEADNVKVHYKGMLIDGKTFDSSYDRGEPIEFNLGGVIPGWREGLTYMTVGSTYRFVIPHDLAYGTRGTRGIPPYSALVFEVELLEINPTPPPMPEGGIELEEGGEEK